ncbi:MAG: septum formation protein Maf [Bacteroidota bacterium]|jgi:septum formation protein
MTPLILASQSPRRKQLLEWASIPFTVIVSDVEEDFPPSISKEDVPVFIARKKALAVQPRCAGGSIILAADTVVILNDHIIGKPIHREEAVSMLLSLSGVTHQVITGVVMLQGDREISFSQTTSVTFHSLTLSQIEHYVDNYKPYDKAGGYAIQEWIGVVGIQSIDGDFYNVMGLPVSLVIQHLQQFRQPIRSN